MSPVARPVFSQVEQMRTTGAVNTVPTSDGAGALSMAKVRAVNLDTQLHAYPTMYVANGVGGINQLTYNLQSAYTAAPVKSPLLMDNTRQGLELRFPATPTFTEAISVSNNAGTFKYFSVERNGGTSVVGTHSALCSTGPHNVIHFEDSTDSIKLWPTDRTFTTSPGSYFLAPSTATITHNYASCNVGGLNVQQTHNMAQNCFLFNAFLLFNANPTLNFQAQAGPGQSYIAQPYFNGASGGISTMSQNRDFLSQPRFSADVGSFLIVTQWNQFQCLGTISDARTQVTSRRGFGFYPLTTMAGVLPEEIGIYLDNVSDGTAIYGIRSVMTAGDWFISHEGTSPSRFAGDVHINNGIDLHIGTSGSSGVSMRRSGVGIMSLTGFGGSNNENLTLDYETTNNVVEATSTTAAGLKLNLGTLGFYTATPIAQPTVTGAKGGNAALTSLLTQLANLGLIVDSTT